MKYRFLFVIAFILVLSGHTTSAQNILILKDATTKEFKRWKLAEDHIRITLISGQKEDIRVDEVQGYFDRHFQRTYHKRPAPPPIGITLKKGLPYEFVEKILEGKINLYKAERVIEQNIITAPSLPGVPNTDVEYFIEKNGIYKSILSGELNRPERLGLLREFVNDDNFVFQKLAGEGFKLNLKSIVQVLREYNVRSFSMVGSQVNKSIGSICFFTEEKREQKKSLSLKVNDSLTFVFPEKPMLMVQLPVDRPSKVCFVTATDQVCDLISASPYMMSFYEVKVNGGDASLEMERKSSKEGQAFVKFVNSR